MQIYRCFVNFCTLFRYFLRYCGIGLRLLSRKQRLKQNSSIDFFKLFLYINWSVHYQIPEFLVDWKLLKSSNMGAKVSKYWSDVIYPAKFLLWDFYCLEFSTTSNCHAANENLPHLVALWNIFSHSTKLPYFGKISEGNNSAINSYVLHGNLMLC